MNSLGERLGSKKHTIQTQNFQKKYFKFRLLKAMGFTDEDITMLQNLWSLDLKDPEETDSSISLPSSSDEYLSSDGLYLKNLLSKPLANGLREIVTKKPFDPVEYLGHWLLNYKVKWC